MDLDFKQMVADVSCGVLQLGRLETVQVNLGNICNQRCSHCHVGAGPEGEKVMGREVMEEIVFFLSQRSGLCLDITGGCPEMNPDFKFFVENARAVVSKMIARTNLTVFYEDGLGWIPRWYRDHGVAIVGSLPCYSRENVDAQRGEDVFDRSIESIRMLNKLGYGEEERLELNLVYNPGGDFLPGPQSELEADYKKYLHSDFGIRFDRLFTITNAPIGRFRKYLQANGKLDQYMKLLIDNFNAETIGNIMCRKLVSVDYRGLVYNCDFNQALDLPIIDFEGEVVSVGRLEEVLSQDVAILTGEHCFCCTAGAGSSCKGTLVEQDGVG